MPQSTAKKGDLRSLPNAATSGAQAARAVSLGDYLGPASVVEAEGPRTSVELLDGAVVPVEMALALPYEPVVGDRLLVVGRGAHHYVIGVLHGAGRTVLSLPGNVDLHASGGTLSLSGDQGVAIQGPELEIQVGKMRMIADTLLQTFASVYQRVSELLSVQASEAHTLVEKTSFTKAKNATLLTEETVTVNGKQIHLG
jgi:hypothetical protein